MGHITKLNTMAVLHGVLSSFVDKSKIAVAAKQAICAMPAIAMRWTIPNSDAKSRDLR
jgi:hypothetical protein